MEVFLVYGLVLLFFVFVILFIVVVLSSHPYTEPSKPSRIPVTSSSSSTDNKIAYGILAVILAFLCVVAILSERGSRTHTSLPA